MPQGVEPGLAGRQGLAPWVLIFASGLGVLEAYTWGLKVADEGPFQDMVSKLLLPSDYYRYPPMFDIRYAVSEF